VKSTSDMSVSLTWSSPKPSVTITSENSLICARFTETTPEVRMSSPSAANTG